MHTHGPQQESWSIHACDSHAKTMHSWEELTPTLKWAEQNMRAL